MKNKKKLKKTNLSTRWLILGAIILLFLISVLTRFQGYIDVTDYTDTAKFFAGEYSAKLRTAHSVIYGIIHSPFVKLTDSFIIFKITSVLWLSLLILSVYKISKKNRKILLLFILSPIVWYMSPWINTIQIASLIFLWSYYFTKKFDEKEKLRYLVFSGLLIGLAWNFWEAVIYFALILSFSFLYNKKVLHFVYFFIFIFIAVLPRLIIDQLLFGFAFYSILKHFFALLSFAFTGGVYGQVSHTSFIYLFNVLSVIILIPFFIFLLYKKNNFFRNKKTIIFLTFSLLMIIFNNSEIRYLLLVYPILILSLGKLLNRRQFQKQIIIFIILSIFILNLYLIQIKYETNASEFKNFLQNFPHIKFNSTFSDEIVLEDLNQIGKDFPNEIFIVGNGVDDYQQLAHIYWGEKIREFVSIQDYELFLKNQSSIAQGNVCSHSKPWNRRDLCFSVELRKTINDQTDYGSINYAIGFDKNFSITNFKLSKQYKVLSIFRKT